MAYANVNGGGGSTPQIPTPPGWTPPGTTNTPPKDEEQKRKKPPAGWDLGAKAREGTQPAPAPGLPTTPPAGWTGFGMGGYGSYGTQAGQQNKPYFLQGKGVNTSWFDAIKNAFGVGKGSAVGRPFDYGTRPYLQNNTAAPNIPAYKPKEPGQQQAQSPRPELPTGPGRGYFDPGAISKSVAERYADWLNNNQNSYYLPPIGSLPLPETPETSGYGGGYGGYGYGWGGGGGRGRGNSDYDSWLKGLLTRWNI